MLVLYHNDMSLCAQKVRLCLAEKGLEWESRHLVLRAGDWLSALPAAHPARPPSRWTPPASATSVPAAAAPTTAVPAEPAALPDLRHLARLFRQM